MEKETIQLDFEKMGGLVPAVVQDDVTQKVLMVGFMNEAAFWSQRSHRAFWVWSC